MTRTVGSTREQALARVLEAVTRSAAQADADASFPVEVLDELRDSGLLALLVPIEYGGAGGSLAELVDTTISLSRLDMSVGMIFSMHCQQVLTVVRHARGAFRERMLTELGTGRCYLASVTTERGKGGHLLSSASPVVAQEGMLLIDRDCPIVTGGLHADAFLITALAPGASSPGQVSLFFAERAALNVEVRGGWEPLGMRATQSVPMRLVGSLPLDQLIGEPGGFSTIVASTFGPLAHVGWSAAWLGAASGALARTVQYLRSEAGRRQFDPSSELLLSRLARIRGRLEAVNALLRHTVTRIDQGGDLSGPSEQILINSLKVQAAEQCFTAVDEMIELAGLRLGYLRGSPLLLERVFRDLRSASLNYGNDRLYLVNGALALRDRQVRLA